MDAEEIEEIRGEIRSSPVLAMPIGDAMRVLFLLAVLLPARAPPRRLLRAPLLLPLSARCMCAMLSAGLLSGRDLWADAVL